MASEILSVGIDVGTSTTQVIFSKLMMENMADYFSAPRISIVGKELIYKSEIHTTPLKTSVLLDGEAIRRIVETEYRKAGFAPDDLDTGAVIITGESARKENAQLLTQQLSSIAGEFVVSTAGPDLESVIAGKGSGAFQYSMDHECSVVNLDIGGGTTNIVVFDCGQVRTKCCFDIGGRLIRLAEDSTVRSVSPAAQAVADAVGVSVVPGARTSVEELRKITDKMAQLLAQALGVVPAEPLLERLRTPGSSSGTLYGQPIGGICFSGGVADCIYATKASPLQYGDIGVLLGASIREGSLFQSLKPIPAGETICATVVGAGTYTTSISGSTIECSDDIFPMKNVPVLKLSTEEQERCLAGDVPWLREKGAWFLKQSDSEQLILAFPGKTDPDYEQVKRLAGCVVTAMDEVLPAGKPVVAVLETDMAKAVGLAMKLVCAGKRHVAAIDGIRVEEGDYLDLGRPLMNGLVVPVVVKTLVFG